MTFPIPSPLLSELEERYNALPSVPRYGPCSCDGFSFGHEPGCDRKQVGEVRQYDGALAEEICDAFPQLLSAIRSMQEENERLREALRQIRSGSTLGKLTFESRMRGKKSLTWHAVNVLQDNLGACHGTALQALQDGSN